MDPPSQYCMYCPYKMPLCVMMIYIVWSLFTCTSLLPFSLPPLLSSSPLFRFEFPNELSNFTRDVSSDFSSNFSVPHGYWSMIIILNKMDEVSVNKTLNQTLFRRPYYPLAVPFGLSYSCSSPTYNNFSNGNESILLHGIQVTINLSVTWRSKFQ